MPSTPPSFGAQPYWDTRFTNTPTPFDWLSSPSSLDAPILHALERADHPKPQILHIGCGTSLLSFRLRAHVQGAHQIHNIDYSSVAVDLGRKRERETMHGEGRMSEDVGLDGRADADVPVSWMRWDAADLLDHASLLRVCKQSAYAVVVDKSTSDAVACADSVLVPLPYPVELCAKRHDALNVEGNGSTPRDPTHPLYILAVHLALVTKTGARWIALSYSAERFPWCDGTSYAPPRDVPDPRLLWRLVERWEVESRELRSEKEGVAESVTYRPKVMNWVYVLERTEVPLFVRGSHI